MNNAHYEAAVAALATFLPHRVLRPNDDGYESARLVWNATADHRPAVIVRPKGVSDVIATVSFAREHDLPVAVRSGGHSMAGHGTSDGVVIDLSGMKGINIDPVTKVARVEPGLQWAEVAAEAQRYGLGLTSGDMGSVGVGGLTLGGGIGWMVRKHGLTIDNLFSVELVTADGDLITASADENQELFWGIRGGGGNFGIVTSFQFRLHSAGTILGGAVIYDAADAPTVVPAITRYAASAPDELTTMMVFMSAPPAPFIPPEKHGAQVLMVLMCYTGTISEGERVVAPLRTVAQPLADLVAPMPYPAMFEMTKEGGERGKHHYTRSMFMKTIESESLDVILTQAQATLGSTSMLQLRPLGGAMSRVHADATAFAHRDAALMVTLVDSGADTIDARDRQARIDEVFTALRPYASGVYVNFLSDEGEARIREAYSARTYDRLVALKDTYDPSNVFAINQNIRPTAAKADPRQGEDLARAA